MSLQVSMVPLTMEEAVLARRPRQDLVQAPEVHEWSCLVQQAQQQQEAAEAALLSKDLIRILLASMPAR